MEQNIIKWPDLSLAAWGVRENAHLFGKTKVGAALISQDGKIFTGCNVEHLFRSHDIHAEVNAIGNMIAGGEKKIIAILIVAEREKFTPCGGCMDWIFQFGDSDCLVGFQNIKEGVITIYTSGELMPHYPF
jgi:cytidine deaminase